MTRSFLVPVPVVPVLLWLDRYPDHRGRYWCPFHDDERPGGKPSAEVREDPTELSCWSCGRTANAPEIIAEVMGCPLREAMITAVEVGGVVVPAPRRRRPGPSPQRLEAELARQTTDVRYPRDVDPVEAFSHDRGWPGDVGFLAYLRSWGWAGDYRGRVVIPHRNAAGELTGLRWRRPPRWDKDSRPRSSFLGLYGADRLTAYRYGEVWLAEGESDTVWGGYFLEPLEIAVLGLPGGSYRPRESDLGAFTDKIVVVVLDPDAAGDRARDRWIPALRRVARSVIDLRLRDGIDLDRHPKTPVELRGEILG